MKRGIFILLGSNIGNRNEQLRRAIQLLESEEISCVRFSSLYRTSPWGNTDQEFFLNQVVEIHTTLSAESLLEKALETERTMGRVRQEKWGPRTIDIDILLYGTQVMTSQYLTIPHVELHLRRFTLAPLAEIAAELIHPLLKKSIGQLLTECQDPGEVYIEETSASL